MAEGAERPAAGARPALVLQHDPDAPPALLAAWARERGLALEVVDARGPLPADVAERPFVVALGSEAAAYDDTLPWLAPELELLRTAVAADVPVLAICFGAQALARALGGEVGPLSRTEVGWQHVDTLEPEVVPSGPWLQWHRDAFVAPPRAELLATSAAGHQAFRLGPHLAVQFHPEVDAGVVAGWARDYPESAALAGTTAEAILADTRRLAADGARAAWRLFDAFAAGARLPAPSRGSRSDMEQQLRDRPTGDLVKDLSTQLSTLVRQELELAKAEVTAKGKEAGIGAGLLGGAGVVALFGVGALTAAAVLALDTVMAGWLAALIVAVVWFAIAGTMALIGKGRAQRAMPPAPERAVESVKEDVRFTKESVEAARR